MLFFAIFTDILAGNLRRRENSKTTSSQIRFPKQERARMLSCYKFTSRGVVGSRVVESYKVPNVLFDNRVLIWHSTKHGLDCTGQLNWTVELDNWTGQLDWTIGLGFQWDSVLLNRRSLTDSKVYEMFLRKTKRLFF